MKRVLWIVTLAATIAALVMLGACSSPARNSTAPPSTNPNVDTQDTPATGDGGNSSAPSGGGGAIPKSLPADVPIYPGATYISSTESPPVAGRSVPTVTLSLGSADESAKINEWYVSELAKNGWKVVSKAATGANYVIATEKGSLQLQVSLYSPGPGTSKTSVNVVVNEK